MPAGVGSIGPFAGAAPSVWRAVRRGRDVKTLMRVVCKRPRSAHHGYRVGLPCPHGGRERLDADASGRGGSSHLRRGEDGADALPAPGRRQAIALSLPLPPTLILEWRT